MVQLILSEPAWVDDGDGHLSEQVVSILKKLESVIWSLVTSSGRAESRLWLCKTISCLTSITPQAQREIFMNLLRSKPSRFDLATQVLQMIFEKRPKGIGSILAKKSHMLEKFFRGNPRRILQWFGNFGEFEHSKGARALSQFAFVNRDICWEELEWKGKHGQSPAIVATKPHYFLDLDVEQTVENFLENVPEFWSSDELADSLKDGEILLVDTRFFIDCFVQLMFRENSKEVWEIISEYVMEESFSLLCNHLLILLEERDLLAFLKSVRKFSPLRLKSYCCGKPSNWLEILLSMVESLGSIDDLLLLNAVVNHGRQLLRLLHEEDNEQERKEIERLVSDISRTSSVSIDAFMNKCLKKKEAEGIKLLGVHSFVLQYRMSVECRTAESWETLFIKNSIRFRKSNNYHLLDFDESADGSDSDDEDSFRTKRRKKAKMSKKKRRKYDDYASSDNDPLDLDVSSVFQGSQPRDGSWLLSIDDYSTSWNMLDLPEHLAMYCFATWMKWVFSRWNSLD